MELVRIHNATGSDEPSTGAMDIVRREDEHGYVLGEVGEEGNVDSANHPDDDDDDGYLIGSHTDLQLSSPERTKKVKRHRVPQDDSKQHEIDQKRLGIVVIGVGQLDPNWERENDGARLQNHTNRQLESKHVEELANEFSTGSIYRVHRGERLIAHCTRAAFERALRHTQELRGAPPNQHNFQLLVDNLGRCHEFGLFHEYPRVVFDPDRPQDFPTLDAGQHRREALIKAYKMFFTGTSNIVNDVETLNVSRSHNCWRSRSYNC
jgi:hypothetical protein